MQRQGETAKAGAATFKAKSLVPLLASEIKTFLGPDNIKAPTLVIDIAPN